MTAKKHLKRLVRARAAKTGESYTAALRHFPPIPKEATVTSVEPEVSQCSFCGKRETEVQRLFAGPGVYICDSCVEFCSSISSGEFDLSHAKPPSTAPDDDVLAWLPGVAQTIRNVEKDLQAKIEMLRMRGVGWGVIASALGLDEADAQALFSQEPGGRFGQTDARFWWRRDA